MSRPAVSVCIATHNRVESLARLLDALAEQTLGCGVFEVVVTDDASTDGTADLLRRRTASSPYPLQVVRLPANRGPAAARNAAWTRARAELVAFTDDDCLPAPTWLAAVVAGMGELDVGVGRVARPPAEEGRAGLFARDLVAGRRELRWYATADVTYRRDALERLGGFDESFRAAAGEDTELGLRAEEAGLRIGFLDDAVVFHEVRRGGVAATVCDQGRWADLVRVFALHPSARADTLYLGRFWRRSHAELLLLALGLLAPQAGVRAALAAPWLHGKLCRDLPEGQLVAVATALPALLLVDTAEVVAALRGSWRHRTLVL